MGKRIWVDIYCDSTGLFSEYECNVNNICSMSFDEDIVRKWYYDQELNKWEGDEDITYPYSSFDQWIRESYICDEVDYLYDFAVENGDDPTFGIEGKSYVFYRDEDNYKYIVFEGNYDECRKFGRENDWVWGEDECELEVM